MPYVLIITYFSQKKEILPDNDVIPRYSIEETVRSPNLFKGKLTSLPIRESLRATALGLSLVIDKKLKTSSDHSIFFRTSHTF